MGQRIDLHEMLVSAVGSRNVYFQAPEGLKMKYPCIVYERDRIEGDYASNYLYMDYNRYTITVIDKDPESEIPNKVAHFPMCRHDRHFVTDNLHHDVFTLYY